MVYIIWDSSDYVKIGKAEDLINRMKGLQTANPHELQILKTIQCIDDLQVEAALHAHFREYRVHTKWKYQSEWFLKSAVDEFINMNDDQTLNFINSIRERKLIDRCHCDWNVDCITPLQDEVKRLKKENQRLKAQIQNLKKGRRNESV